MARTDPQLNLRLPPELKDRLEEAAALNNRSVTSETVARLMISFDDTKNFEFLVSRMEMRVAESELDNMELKMMVNELGFCLKTAIAYIEKGDQLPKKLRDRQLGDWQSTIDDAEKMYGEFSQLANDPIALANELSSEAKKRIKDLDAATAKSKRLFGNYKQLDMGLDDDDPPRLKLS